MWKSVWVRAGLLGIVLLVIIRLVFSPAGAHAFDVGEGFEDEIHQDITKEALGFLRSSVLDDIVDEHQDWADSDAASSVKWVHMDGCTFGESVDQINYFYLSAIANIVPGAYFEPWSATDDFGRVFHPAQDFYSHSNWVELGFPLGDNPATPAVELSSSDLIDFSTSRAGTDHISWWNAPGALEVVRNDILLDDLVDTPIADTDGVGALDPLDVNADGVADERDSVLTELPANWSFGLLPHPTNAGAAGWVPGVDIDGDATFTMLPTSGFPVPIMTSGADRRLLLSGIGDRKNPSIYMNQCDPFRRNAAGQIITPKEVASCDPGDDRPDDYSCIAYEGSRFALAHGGSDRSELNKDNPDAAPSRFPKARALAWLQSQYEWCRLVNLAGSSGGDGTLLALWVREGASANLPGTPCAPDGDGGPLGVRVTIEQIQVLDDKENPEDSPGELNFSLALYDDYANFHRLTKSRMGPVDAHELDILSSNPPAVTQCVNTPDHRFKVALHGWDDDGGSDDDFDQNGTSPGDANVDDAIIGFTRTLDADDIAIGSPLVFETQSSDLRVRYRVNRVGDVDHDGLDACGEPYYGTHPLVPDTDGDGLLDGVEVNGLNLTDPLNADTDGDGLEDGQEDSNGNGQIDAGETDPNDSDSDRDRITDGIEVLGSNPTDPLDPDSDDDTLADGAEDANQNGARDPGETNPNDADTDDDLLGDGQELEVGTDPLDSDSDNDGLIDGKDTDWLEDAVTSLPLSAFRTQGNRNALLNHLGQAEADLAKGKSSQAKKKLENARDRADGCGIVAANDDWIKACPEQLEIRELLDILLANL